MTAALPSPIPPFFVLGVDRSGTTLLRLILNAHSQLAIPTESHFLATLMDELPLREPLTPEQSGAACRIVCEEPRFRMNWHVEEAELRAAVSRLETPRLADVADAVYTLEIAASGKPRWGDKTPLYLRRIPDLAAAFPDARFVHLVRDGRDVSMSLRKTGWRGRTVNAVARYWGEGVREADEAGGALGSGRYLRVAYEDLVLDAEPSVTRICEFLGVDFEAAMLSFHEDASSHIPESERDIHAKLVRAPRREDVQRWKHESKGYQVFLFEGIAGSSLERTGYQRRFAGPWRLAQWLAVPPYRLFHALISGALRTYYLLPARWRKRWAEAGPLRRARLWLTRL